MNLLFRLAVCAALLGGCGGDSGSASGEGTEDTGDTEDPTDTTGPTTSTSTSDTTSQSTSTTGGMLEGHFEIGWGEEDFNPIGDGDEFRVVFGGQGLFMFPMPIRGSEFTLPDDPSDYTDDKAPFLDLEMDIEGFNDGIGGHFKRIANYPIPFTILPDGTYEFVYVAVIFPDDVDPVDVDGLPADLWVRLRPYDSAPHEVEITVTVVVDDVPG